MISRNKVKNLIGKAVLALCLIAVAFICGRGSVLFKETETDSYADTVPVEENANVEEATEVAKRYLEAAPYSKDGLRDTLQENEYFTESAASEAVNNLDTDWQKQAELSIERHLNADGISEKKLREYMEAEKFTPEQIDSAIEAVSPDWQQQAQMKKEALSAAGVESVNIPATLLSLGFRPQDVKDLY